MLLHHHGAPLFVHGNVHDLDVDKFGALMAGGVSVGQETAKMMHETEFSVLWNQGSDKHIYCSMIDPYTVLLVMFGPTIYLEAVRSWVKENGIQIRRILEAARRLAEEQGYTKPAASVADSSGELDEITSKRLDIVFGKPEKQ